MTTDRNGIVDIFLVIVWRVMIYVRVIVDSQYMYLVDLFIPFLCNIIVCTTETSIPVCVSSGSCNNARILVRCTMGVVKIIFSRKSASGDADIAQPIRSRNFQYNMCGTKIYFDCPYCS